MKTILVVWEVALQRQLWLYTNWKEVYKEI